MKILFFSIHRFQKLFIENYLEQKRAHYINKKQQIGQIHIIYRISDAGFKKVKFANINNENCLRNAVNVFPQNIVDWNIICDNCSNATLEMVRNFLPENKISIVSVGHGAGTFNLALDQALTFPENDVVYFLENDYFHKENALDVLRDGFEIGADILTLYDHPDKYDRNHIFYYYMQKHTHLYLGQKSHWRTEFSTTMTFAARVSFLKKYQNIFRRWTKGSYPDDFDLFNNLCSKKIELVSPIPGVSTHGEIAFACPFTEWEKF